MSNFLEGFNDEIVKLGGLPRALSDALKKGGKIPGGEVAERRVADSLIGRGAASSSNPSRNTLLSRLH